MARISSLTLRCTVLYWSFFQFINRIIAQVHPIFYFFMNHEKLIWNIFSSKQHTLQSPVIQYCNASISWPTLHWEYGIELCRHHFYRSPCYRQYPYQACLQSPSETCWNKRKLYEPAEKSTELRSNPVTPVPFFHSIYRNRFILCQRVRQRYQILSCQLHVDCRWSGGNQIIQFAFHLLLESLFGVELFTENFNRQR